MSDLAGRRKERYRLAALGTAANYLSGILMMLVTLLSVPLTLPYLGEERFGIWMAISSLSGMLAFLDLGVGNGLISRVAAANSKGDRAELAIVISHGLAVMLIIGSLIAGIFYALWSFLPLERLIQVSGQEAGEEVRACLAVFVAVFAASIPLVGAQKIFMGLQLSWQAHLIKAIGAALSIVALLIAARLKAAPAPLILVTYGVQTGILFLLVMLLAGRRLLSLTAAISGFGRSLTKPLVRVGGLFFILQIGTVVGWGADSILIASLLGAAEVAKFAVVQKLFQFVSFPLMMLNAPLWGAYADARSHGDWEFVASTLKHSMFLMLGLGMVGVTLLLLFAPFILEVWVKDAVVIPLTLLVLFGIWTVIEVLGNAFAMCLNGLNVVVPQVLTVTAFCLVSISAKVLAIHVYGVVGVVGATILSYILVVAIPYFYLTKKGLLSKHQNAMIARTG